MKIKSLLLGALAIACFAGSASADIIVGGTTTGTFAATGTNVYGGLTFSNGTFLANATPAGTGVGGAINNFGTFALTTQNFVYNSGFTLQVAFALPPGSGGGSFSALVTGVVVTTLDGVLVNFNNTPQVFTAANGQSFSLLIQDTAVGAGDLSQPITGILQQVPEGGATAAMLGLGCLAVAAIRRKFAV